MKRGTALRWGWILLFVNWFLITAVIFTIISTTGLMGSMPFWYYPGIVIMSFIFGALADPLGWVAIVLLVIGYRKPKEG